jgi:hypothetical protein
VKHGRKPGIEIRVIASDTLGAMRILNPVVTGSRGSSLPVTIVMLTLLTMIGAAIVETSRFGNLAARAHVSAAAAMHLADTGLAAYERGVVGAFGTTVLRSSSGQAVVTADQVVRLTDSSVVVLVESRGTAPVGMNPTGRRNLQVLMRIDPSGDRQRVAGSLMEDF